MTEIQGATGGDIEATEATQETILEVTQEIAKKLMRKEGGKKCKRSTVVVNKISNKTFEEQ